MRQIIRVVVEIFEIFDIISRYVSVMIQECPIIAAEDY